MKTNTSLTHEQKITSPKRLFIFVRADGFYLIELPEATVADNAECNPGTIRVEDAKTGEVVWLNDQDQP
jgi:hypothetical protein